jgi:hypothetical protein
VDKGVLPWKCKSTWTHTNLLEDCPIAVISIESILEVTKSLLCNYIMSNNVTKLQECAKCPYCIARDMTFDSR